MRALLVLLLLTVQAEAQEMQPRLGSTPNPDPTLLTTSQLNREVELLKQQIVAAIASLREVIETKVEGLSNTVDLRNQKVDDQISARSAQLSTRAELVERQISDMLGLIEEKFAGVDSKITEKFLGIQRQFEERDTRVAQTSVDSKLAIDAALQAAKEAVGKSELGTKDVIQQQGDLLRTVTSAQAENIDDLKQRITAMEAKTLGAGEAKEGISGNVGLAVGVGGVLIAGIGLILALGRREPQIRYVQAPLPQPLPQPLPLGVTTTTNTSSA